MDDEGFKRLKCIIRQCCYGGGGGCPVVAMGL